MTTYVPCYEPVTIKNGATAFLWVVWRLDDEDERRPVAIVDTLAEAEAVAAERNAA